MQHETVTRASVRDRRFNYSPVYNPISPRMQKVHILVISIKYNYRDERHDKNRRPLVQNPGMFSLSLRQI